MNRIARIWGPGLVAAVAIAAVGCLDVAEPVPVVEVRVAHAAPGLGDRLVLVNQQAIGTLTPFGHTFFGIEDAPTHFAFAAETDTIARQVTYEESVNAVVLMNTPDPAVVYFPLEREFGALRILVVNGDFTRPEPLEVRVGSDGQDLDAALEAGESTTIEPAAGAVDLWVRVAGAEDFTRLESFVLAEGDHGFLILLPDPAVEAEIGWMLF